MYVKRNAERLSCNNFSRRKAESIAYSEPVFVAFVTHHAKSMRSVTSLCHLQLFRLYHIFPHYLIIGTILRKMLSNIKCVFLFSTSFA